MRPQSRAASKVKATPGVAACHAGPSLRPLHPIYLRYMYSGRSGLERSRRGGLTDDRDRSQDIILQSPREEATRIGGRRIVLLQDEVHSGSPIPSLLLLQQLQGFRGPLHVHDL